MKLKVWTVASYEKNRMEVLVFPTDLMCLEYCRARRLDTAQHINEHLLDVILQPVFKVNPDDMHNYDMAVNSSRSDYV